MNQIKFHAPWHRLHTAFVGASYSPAFYEPIKNSKIRDSLQKIARETEADYQYIVYVLEQLDVQVVRPTIDPNLTIMDYTSQGKLDFSNAHSFTLIPRPPMQPRDSFLIIGDVLIETLHEFKWFKPLLSNFEYKYIKAPQAFDAPMITALGNKLVVDCRDYPWLPDYVKQQFPNYNVVPVTIGGHNDAVFCPVKPGVIVSTYHHSNYADTFPGWEVKFIENQSWNAIPDWRKFKHANVNKWWIPENDNNPEFANFVDTWLTNWVGYVKETVFDVNMLQLDENVVLVNNYNSEMFDFFKKHNITPVVVPFRHRFFWDGGIHCITGDLYREGSFETYD